MSGQNPELDDERRRYYRLTNLGQRVAAAEIRRLEQTLAVAHSKPLLNSPGQTIAIKGV